MRHPDKSTSYACPVHGSHSWRAWRLREMPADWWVDAWLLRCDDPSVPNPHILCVVRLSGADAAHGRKEYRDAEYELVSCLLHQLSRPDPDDHASICEVGAAPLTQFHGIDDAHARELLEQLVDAAITGRLEPEPDHRAPWDRAVWRYIESKTTGTPRGNA